MFQPAESVESTPPAAPSTLEAEPKPSFEPFLLVPQTRKFFEGQSRNLPIQDFWLIVFFVLFALMAVILAIAAAGEYADAWRLLQSGKITEGTITRRSSSSGKSPTYYLTYDFYVSGSDARFSREQKVRRTTYDQHPQGSPVTVAYLPNDPNISRLAGRDADDSIVQANLPETGLLLLVALAFLYFLVRPVVRDRRLARQGRILEGKLVNCDGRLAGSKRRYYKLTVQYQFTSPSGAFLSGKQDAQREDMRHKLRPRAGTPVAVLYVDDRNYKML